MASYTIGATAFEYSEADSVENPENAYDNSASTYATVDMNDENEHVYLYAFNFSKIPQGEVVTSITAKVKSCGSGELGDCHVWLQSTADSSGVKLSADMTPATSVSTKTLSLTADFSTIMSYANTLSVAFSHDGIGATFDIYAVYFTATTSPVKPSKVVYGNETLIDLTGDTATALDVVSGKTFHLANGIQATGAFSPSVATATKSGVGGSRTMTFTDLAGEPSWFVCVETGQGSSAKICIIIYEGGTIKAYQVSSAGYLGDDSTYISFAYSNHSLTLTYGSTNNSFGNGTYKLYYLC